MSNHEHNHNTHSDSKERAVDTKTSKKIGGKTLRVRARDLIIGAGIAVAVVGGGVWYMNNGNISSSHDSQQQSQTQEETPEQREARQKEEDKKLLAAEKSFDERVAEIQLPANLSPEEFREEYLKTLTNWMNEGASDILGAKMRAGTTIDDIALENANIYATALFGKDWAKGDGYKGKQIDNFYRKFRYANELTLNAYKDSADAKSPVKYRSWVENADGDEVPKSLSGYSIGINYKDNSTESGVSADIPDYAVIYTEYAAEGETTRITQSSISFDVQRRNLQ